MTNTELSLALNELTRQYEAAEAARRAAEDSLQRVGEARQAFEKQCLRAEMDRQDAEALRRAAETSRELAEAEGDRCEMLRRVYEQQRVQAEEKQQQFEIARQGVNAQCYQITDLIVQTLYRRRGSAGSGTSHAAPDLL